ncbi:MAG: 50S ribosomal protein L6 [Candidatus Neomarinimicrobiota bacterium]
MSRIGNSPILFNNDVKIKVIGQNLEVSGKKGSHSFIVHNNINIELKDNILTFNRVDNSAVSRSMHGTTRQIVNNMIIGVSEGFKKELEIVGVGYQASIDGNRLKLQLGFSHDIFFDLPEDIKIKTNRTSIIVEGNDKQLVGSVASKIRSFRKPEPYKGKGVRYKNEHIRIKQGKTVGE